MEVSSQLPIFSCNLWEVALFWAFPVGHGLWGGTCGHAENTYSAVGRPAGNIPENISKSIIRGRGAARWLRSKVLAAKADHLHMIPKTQMAEWENQLSKHSLTSICVPRQARHTQIPTHDPLYVALFSSEAFLNDSVDTKSCTKKFIQKSKVESPRHKQKTVLKQVSRPSQTFPNLPLLCSPRKVAAPEATSQFYCTWELRELFPAERSQGFRSLACKELPVRGRMYCSNARLSYEVKYKSKDFSKSGLGI